MHDPAPSTPPRPGDADSSTTHGGARAQLLRLRSILVRRSAQEEQREGLFELLVSLASFNQARVQLFRTAHAAILKQLDAIIARVGEGTSKYDHRPAMADLASRIERQDTAKSTLLQDSFNNDMGGEG